MVKSATNLTRSGLSDFLLQRVTAIVLGLYTVCVVGFLVVTPGVSYEQWLAYQGSGAMRLFSTLAVLATAGHAWVGMWTIGTDYIRGHYFGRQATLARGLYQLVCAGVLFIFVGWALELFWRL